LIKDFFHDPYISETTDDYEQYYESVDLSDEFLEKNGGIII
jgi:hypothetical protein